MHRVIASILNNCAQKTMVYQVRALGKEWVLRKETILRYVPGILKYPVKRNRQLRLSSRATIDIEKVITGNVFVNHDMISPKQYAHCLNELMDSIEETEVNRLKDQTPLLNILNTSWKRRRGNVSAMLYDFFCFADLVQKANLGGSDVLQSDLTTFFINHARPICRSLPLKQSLQIVDMCPDSDFQACMERLLVKLPSEQRHELEERRGKVGLCFKRRPSDKIKRFMRRRGGRNPHNTMSPVMRSFSAERLLEQGVDLYYVAQKGGRVALPGGGRRSPGQGPYRRNRY